MSEQAAQSGSPPVKTAVFNLPEIFSGTQRLERAVFASESECRVREAPLTRRSPLIISRPPGDKHHRNKVGFRGEEAPFGGAVWGSPPVRQTWAELLDVLLTLATLPVGADGSWVHHLNQGRFNPGEKNKVHLQKIRFLEKMQLKD